ncbi:MAG: cob(I)yrinic acid a,c-diamide adenosyltransferase [Proteobacteria bacterium]|nr:cob(I)yrinic acid a,c-diamide adenosyltransferase [Pseudomonadota bacterium]
MRLTKIYTKTGDQGHTQLATGGAKVPKDHIRIQAYGDIDELSCFVGDLVSHALAYDLPKTYQSMCQTIQQELFDIGGELSFPEDKPITDYSPCYLRASSSLRLEQEIDTMNSDLEHLKNFIVPGGHPLGSKSHICRAVSRRAERSLVHLAQQENVRQELLQYLNRLSDWFFVLSRIINKHYQHPEVLWNQARYSDSN